MGLLDLWNKPNDEGDNSTKSVIEKAITLNKPLKITYKKFNGEVSSRVLSNIAYNNSFESDGFYNDHIKGFCSLRKEERTFKIARIISVSIIDGK
ncbi:MAG: hypothetical protein ACTHOM_01500 [Allomuricauda sp.]